MSERTLHKAVCDYLKYSHPGVLFNSDLSGSMKLTVGQAVAMKSLRSNRGFPDLVVYHKSFTGKYAVLFIELKEEGTKLFKKSVDPFYLQPIYATPHIKEQAEVIERLNSEGYYACFAVGIDEAIQVIKDYFEKL